MSSVNTLTLAGLCSTCRETGLPLGAHSVYKWSRCVTVHPVWALLSAGGPRLLENISSMFQTLWHPELMSGCISYCTHFLSQSITMHSQAVNSMHILYITSCIVHTYCSFTVSHTHSALSIMYTRQLILSHTHTQKNWSSLFESAGVVIIHGREMGMSNQRPAH